MPNFLTAAISRQSRHRSMGAAVDAKVAFAPELLGPLDNFRSRSKETSLARKRDRSVRDGLRRLNPRRSTIRPKSQATHASLSQVGGLILGNIVTTPLRC